MAASCASHSSEQRGVAGRRFVELGLSQYWPRLVRSERRIDRDVNNLGAFSFPFQYSDVRTFDDARDEGTLVLTRLGGGQWITDQFSLSGYIEGGARQIDSRQRLSGLFTVDTEFEAALFTAGIGGAYYPLGPPDFSQHGSITEMLAAGRPAIVQSVEVEYLDARGDASLRMFGLPLRRSIVNIHDWNVSYNPGILWHAPLNERWSVTAGASYHFHVYRHAELDGFAVTLATRLSF